MRQFWRAIRNRIGRQPWFEGMLAHVIWLALRFVHRTNPLLPETFEVYSQIDSSKPVIFAMWHGQHVLTPFAAPKGLQMAAMFSKSGDAELNARVVEKLGIEIVRGSGGRDKVQRADKGGAQALILLKKAMARGKCAVMIADISKGSARMAGEGVILLARISGRPILPVAYASSRAVTFRKSWDKTRMAMPFGRGVLCAGEPLFVNGDAGPDEIAKARGELTLRLNGATQRAYALVGAKP